MLPERIDDQRRLILLYGQCQIALLIHPWLPAAAEVAIRRVLVQQVAIIGDVFGAEMEERASGVAIARVAEHIRHQRAIAWPHIGVAVARERPDITICRGDNRAIMSICVRMTSRLRL